tara:strand:- start:57 stop:509 length:453 start_codon:yes stop_codon:yes gene_type:complete
MAGASKFVQAGIDALIDATKSAPKSMGALGKMDNPVLGEKEADSLYDSYLENLAKPKESISDDAVMRDVLDSFLQNNGISSKAMDLPAPDGRLKLYDSLGIGRASPNQADFKLGSEDWYKEYDLLAPPMNFETFLKNRYDLDVVDIMGVD